MKKIIKNVVLFFVGGIISATIVSCETHVISTETDEKLTIDLSQEEVTTFSEDTKMIATYKGKEYFTKRKEGAFLNPELVAVLSTDYTSYVIPHKRRIFLFDTTEELSVFSEQYKKSISKNICEESGSVDLSFARSSSVLPFEILSLMLSKEEMLDISNNNVIKRKTGYISLKNDMCNGLTAYGGFYETKNLNNGTTNCSDVFISECSGNLRCSECRGAQMVSAPGQTVSIDLAKANNSVTKGRFGGMRRVLKRNSLRSYRVVIQ